MDEEGEKLPSEYGWRAAEPQLHHHRVVAGVEQRYDPRTEGEIDYEVLRDTIIAAFNPPDDDVAEPSIMTAALDRAFVFIVAQPCACPAPDEYGDVEACARCAALGREADVVVER